MPPWEVARTLTDEDKAHWYYRQVEWQKAQNKRAELDSKRQKHGK